ncbi:coiled-coil domain-containing protein 81-like [Brachyhypopomus gauderio]|uniref:coiled-coil domain-containing protein 81-like n=1 Tax=Brachyhypopomus gauderio TaxID=698409 RepID=UPI004042D9F5
MSNTLLSLASEAERNAFPTLSQLSENDVVNIWTNVSSFIERQMRMQKGVCIPGLGAFTFSQQKLELGSKYILIQRPIFLLSEKISQSHCLKQTKPLAVAGDVPVVPLNFAAVSAESPFDRDGVEGCVRETLLLLLRAVSALRTVLLTFQGIGVLSFRHGTVKMRFHRDFISAMDGTGKLLWALTNRPGTSSSVVSGRLSSLQRPATSNAILLPKISSGRLPKEGDEGEGFTQAAEPHGGEETRQGTRLSARPRPPTAKTTAVNSTDDPEAKGPSDMVERLAMSQEPADGAVDKVEVHGQDDYLNPTCTNHPRAGQELCYLCMQRAQRNIPVCLTEERRREELEEEQLLLLIEQQKMEQFLQREQAREEQKREDCQKMAAFNLGVTEALRAKKATKSSQAECQDSYIFRCRPVTPPRLLRQRRYMQELTEQVASRRQRCARDRQDQDLTERLHQVQLADEIAKQRSQELHQKKSNVKILQKALSAQLEHRGTGIPARQPDSDGPVFGVRDGAHSAQAERQRRAREVYGEQLAAASAKKRLALCEHLDQRRRERDMLQRCRKEMMADHVSRYERLQNLRASLEETWMCSADLKRQRDQEERAFIRAGSRLLLDQCDQYRRCSQCKRKTSNCGQSNVWKESRYIPGSRLMV